MKLALLFFYYKDLEVCQNRLEMLRQFNPNSKIFGLYGGPHEEEAKFREGLKGYLDDFYTLPKLDSFWIWIHSDICLLKWYQERGKDLEWDSVVICQWDLLVFDSFEKIFEGMKKDEIYLPNHGTMTKELEDFWFWTSEENYKKFEAENRKELPYMRGQYLAFKKHLAENYNFKEEVEMCIFMFAILPRIFFEKYGTVKDIEIGFTEYKVPTYAKIFGLKAFKKDLGEHKMIPKTGWKNRLRNWLFNRVSQSPMNAYKKTIRRTYIKKQLRKKNGWRIFHPFFKVFRIKKEMLKK